MNSSFQQKDTEVLNTAAVAPAFHLPDASSTMEGALNRALDYSSQQMLLDSPQEGLELLRQGDREALEYCHYRLVQQVAEALGALDDNVRSVYLYKFEATPEDWSLGDRPETLPIHLIVRAERKTGALTSLVAALDRSLVKDYAEMVGPRRLKHVLDVQVVDDSDVHSRRGIAGLFSSLHNRPIQIWTR